MCEKIPERLCAHASPAHRRGCSNHCQVGRRTRRVGHKLRVCPAIRALCVRMPAKARQRPARQCYNAAMPIAAGRVARARSYTYRLRSVVVSNSEQFFARHFVSVTSVSDYSLTSISAHRMAAISTTLFTFLKAGDHVVATNTIYG